MQDNGQGCQALDLESKAQIKDEEKTPEDTSSNLVGATPFFYVSTQTK
jgi:hypothetical protein